MFELGLASDKGGTKNEKQQQQYEDIERIGKDHRPQEDQPDRTT